MPTPAPFPQGLSMPVDVVLASTGRADNIATLLRHLAGQTQLPRQIVLSVVKESDLPTGLLSDLDITVVTGPRGLPAQRNTGLDQLRPGGAIVAFFDDDYIPSRHCIARMATFFAANPDVVGANGYLIADGINSPGVATPDAEALIARYDDSAPIDYTVERPLVGLYGCNMAYRASAIGNRRFDERLKLYGWQEDIDFATQIGLRGRIVKTQAFAGVHQGVKGARTSGLRLGYAQVINPLYLIRKGTMPAGFGLKLMARNVMANHLKLVRPEPWVDRLGRARGNWLGVLDAVRGRLAPERIEAL